MLIITVIAWIQYYLPPNFGSAIMIHADCNINCSIWYGGHCDVFADRTPRGSWMMACTFPRRGRCSSTSTCGRCWRGRSLTCPSSFRSGGMWIRKTHSIPCYDDGVELLSNGGIVALTRDILWAYAGKGVQQGCVYRLMHYGMSQVYEGILIVRKWHL